MPPGIGETTGADGGGVCVDEVGLSGLGFGPLMLVILGVLLSSVKLS